jgi:hypothetical protein
LSGALTLSADPGANLQAATKQYVDAHRDPVFGASGAAHASGAVPDPGAAAGATRYLREDASWTAPGGLSFPLLAPDGTAAAPSYAFSAAPGTGLYRDAATGNMAFTGPVFLDPRVPSSRSLKEAIEPYGGDSLSLIAATPLKRFRYKGSRRSTVAFLAEEAHEELSPDHASVQLLHVIGHLMRAVSQLASRVEALESRHG